MAFDENNLLHEDYGIPFLTLGNQTLHHNYGVGYRLHHNPSSIDIKYICEYEEGENGSSTLLGAMLPFLPILKS